MAIGTGNMSILSIKHILKTYQHVALLTGADESDRDFNLIIVTDANYIKCIQGRSNCTNNLSIVV